VEKCQRAGIPVTLVATDREVEKWLREFLPSDVLVPSVLKW
jgi:hypothetical protein